MPNNTEDVELRYSIDPASDEGDFTALTIMRGDSVEWILTGEQAEVVAALIQREANRRVNKVLDELESYTQYYRTHDMRPPFPKAVPLSAIEQVRKESYE